MFCRIGVEDVGERDSKLNVNRLPDSDSMAAQRQCSSRTSILRIHFNHNLDRSMPSARYSFAYSGMFLDSSLISWHTQRKTTTGTGIRFYAS